MSVVRSIKAVISAEVSGLTGPVKQAERSVDSLGSKVEGLGAQTRSSIGGLGKSFRDNRKEWDEVGSSAMKAGAAVGIGLGLATKASISWESAFAGVKKTVDDSTEGYSRLSDELRQLTKELPASHEEIAGVAEAAGQLGVQRENIVGFTKVMIDLGESTNLSANDAATAIARFANVMGTSLDDVDRIGSAIVGLGNNFATTESEIMSMASRLSGAGRQANLTEGDVLGIATALSSVGIEAEAGGTAFSRVIIEMGKSVDTADDKLGAFARTAGMAAPEFQKLFNENSGEALRRFVQGLGDLQARGESIEPILSELGMTDIRVGDALRRSASSADLFTDAMAQGNDEYEKNIALQEEAEKRYETTESKLQIARNSMKDAAIDAGAVLGPALAEVAGIAASMADAFVKLPEPIQTGAVALAGVASAGLLLLGSGIKVIGWAQDMSDALTKVGASGPRASKGIDLATTAAKRATVAFVGLAVAGALLDFEGAAPGVDELTNSFLEGGDAASIFNREIAKTSEVKGFDYDIRSLGDAMRYSFEPGILARAENVFGKVGNAFGLGDSSAITHAASQLEVLDASLTDLVASGNQAEADKIFRSLAREAEATGFSVEQLEQILPGYTGALAAAENQEILTGNAAGALGGELDSLEGVLGESTEAIEEQVEAYRQWKEEIADADRDFVSLLGAYDAIVAKNTELAESSATSSSSAKDSWEDFYDGHSVNIDEYIEELRRQVTAQSEWETNMLQLSSRVPQAILDELARLGPEGAAFVQELNGATDAELAEIVELWGQRGIEAPNAFAENLRLGAQVLPEIMAVAGKDAADAAAEELASGEKTIQQVIDQYNLNFEVDAETGEAKRTLDGFVRNNSGRTIRIKIATDVSSVGRVYPGIPLANADGGLWERTQRAGLLRAFADGGTIGQAYPKIRGRQSDRGVLWSESGSGPWEAFISGHPAKRGWSRNIAEQTVSRLGGRVLWGEAYANGGIRTSGSGIDYGRLSDAMGPFRTSEIREATKIYVDKVLTNDSDSFVRDSETGFGRLGRP